MPNPSQIFSHESLAGIPEPELVRRLLADSHWRSRFVGLHGIPTDANDYREVLLDGLGKKGDVDILVVNPSRPEFATAIQTKRIKVATQTFQTGKPNRLVAIAELYRQTNILVELGFWQVLCYAIITVDSRMNNNGEYRYDGLTTDLRTTINASLSTEGLHQDAGFVRFELAQPIDHYPLGAGTFSTTLLRGSTVRPQSANVTNWVNRVVAERDA